jgi:hypothetical protein
MIKYVPLLTASNKKVTLYNPSAREEEILLFTTHAMLCSIKSTLNTLNNILQIQNRDFCINTFYQENHRPAASH